MKLRLPNLLNSLLITLYLVDLHLTGNDTVTHTLIAAIAPFEVLE